LRARSRVDIPSSMRSRICVGLVAAALLAAPGSAAAALWENATMATIGATAGWSNKVELADINGDGRLDLLFANGRGYKSPGEPEVNYAFLNQGPGQPFIDVGAELFGEADFSRVIQAGDVDGDGSLDLFVGNTWSTRSRLYLGDGGGGFEEVSATHLPQVDLSVGDAEFGDVDGDGDLDLALADWGPGDPSQNGGAPARLWLNDGGGVFSEAPAGALPDAAIAWSWELELGDLDGDLDLDMMISCKSCAGSFIFLGDGAGGFTDASEGLPQEPNNYDFEALDLSGDGDLDLLTINDRSPGAREHVFVGDGAGGFVDETAARWPDAENPAGDDNMIAFVDVDSDADPDFVVAGLFGQVDRLMINDGAGAFTMAEDAFAPATSPGTLGIAVADLDGDRRVDVVMAEGEADDPDFVFLGVDVGVDAAAPRIDRAAAEVVVGAGVTIRARIHDNTTPLRTDDFAHVTLKWSPLGEPQEAAAMRWYGGLLWRADVLPGLDPAAVSGGAILFEICAADLAGNEACTAPELVELTPGETTGGETETTGDGTSDGTSTTAAASTTGDGGSATATSGGEDESATATATASAGMDDDAGCGCASARPRSGAAGLAMLLMLALRRRRRPA
jgi:MYXO-CTERM domain-containing protein